MSIVSLAGQRAGHWRVAIAEICVHCHSGSGIKPANFAWNPAQDRVDQWTQPSPHRFRSNALGAPRRKGKNGVGLDARSTEGSKRDVRALYGCNNLTASSTNDEAFMAA
jgi:hypothetical protein